MGKFAWVTLATNDSYSLGALVVASSLKRVNTAHELVALVTPGVSDTMKAKLRSVFNLVEEVNVLDSQDAAHLALLKRPELGITFTKLHCWRLTQYEKCVFLDADTLILQNSDELFEREELSAAPDVGWPDCFNSGVFVYRPSLDTFGKLVEFATTKGSFDGGDQGLLNQFFNDWATKDIANRLPFIYNTTTTAVYSYIPAFKQFGDNLKILHFIGNLKPWLLNFDPQSKTVQPPSGYQHLSTFLQFWWTIFCDDVHPNLSPEMNKLQSSFGSTEKNQPNTPVEFLYVPPTFELLPHPEPNNCNTENEINYYDPWENYEKNNTSDVSNIDNNQYFPDNENDNNLNDSSYEEIHNNLEVVYNNLTEQQIPIDHNEQISNKSLDNNTNRVVFSPSSNASLIHPPSAQILPNQVPFEEVNYSIHKESNFLAHGNDNNINEIIINHAIAVSDPLPVNQEENNSPAIESGIAGALAKLTLGANRSSEQEEFENHMRRQCWESGNIDYLGKDSFDNIWRRITQTIESGTKQDFPVATQPEPASETTSTALPDEKLKVDITKKVDDRLNPNERNVIAVCSPHELMRSLSSPGLATEQIITTVLPCGKTVQQKILTFPEREIEIEDYERIEILGPITRKITTETTRIVAGKENQTDVVVRTETLSQETETKAVVEKQQTVSQNILTTQTQSESQQIETNQNQTVALKTKTNTPKISITDVLKPLPDDKFEFDSINNVTTITRKTETGYEMIIATVTPDGRDRVQTKTFFNPVEVSRTEVTEEEYTEERTTSSSTTSNISTANTMAIESKTTDSSKTTTEDTSTTTGTSENTTVAATGEEKTTVTIEKTATGHKEITTITSADGLTRVQTKTFYDPVEIPGEEEVVEEFEETTTTEPVVTTKTTTGTSENTTVAATGEEKTTVTIEKTATGHKEITTITSADGLTRVQTKTFYDPVEIPGEEEVVEEFEETTTTEPVVTTKTTTSTSTVPGAKIEPSSDTQIVTVTSDTNSEQTNVSENTVTRTVTGVETSVETSEETTVISETVVPQIQDSTVNKSETTTTSTTEVATTENTIKQITPGEETTVVTIEKTPTGHKEITTITSAEGLTRVQTKTFYDPVEIPGEEEVVEEYEETTTTEPVVTTTITTNTSTVPSKPVEPSHDTQIVTVTSDTNSEKTDISEQTVTTTVTGEATNVETTEETTTIISSEVTSKPETTTTSITEVETTENTTKQITPGEEKRVVTIEKTETGHKEITTITTADGLTRIETKTFYDPTEEEVVEEYEETTVTEPVVTTKTTTTTSSAPVEITKPIDSSLTVATVDEKNNTQINTQETTEETVVTTTTKTGVATNEEVVEETTVISKEIPAAITKSDDNTTTSVEITEETTITTESVIANNKVPVNKTSEATIDTSKTSTIDTSEQTLITNVTGTETNVKTVEENTTTSVGTIVPQPIKTPADNKVVANISTNVTAMGQVTTVETRSSKETIEVYEESHKSEPTITTKAITNTTVAPKPTEKPVTKPKATPEATKLKNVAKSNQKSDSTKTSTTSSEVTSTKSKTENVVAKTTVGEEKTSVVIEKTPTGHKEITTIVSANGETRILTKTCYDPVEVEEEEEEVEEYEETHTSEPVITTTTTKKTPSAKKDTRLAAAEKTTNQSKKVTEVETTTETLNVKTPQQKLDKKKTAALQKVEKVAGAVTTSVIGQETTTTKTKTSTIDTSKTVTQKSDMSTTSTENTTKTLKDSKMAAIDSKKKTTVANNSATDKTKSSTTTKNQTQKSAPQGEPQTIVTTKRIENGTEHTTTTIFPDGTKKIATKTFFDAVEVSGDEEEIEEYEEIEEEVEEPVAAKPAGKEPPPKPAPAPAPKKLVAPTVEPKPTKEDSQFQPSKLKIPAAFATANAQPSGPVRPPLRKPSVPKVVGASTTDAATTAGAANGASGTKDTPVPPPRKSFFGKLNKTSMLLLLLISLALIYNHCTK